MIGTMCVTQLSVYSLEEVSKILKAMELALRALRFGLSLRHRGWSALFVFRHFRRLLGVDAHCHVCRTIHTKNQHPNLQNQATAVDLVSV